MNKIQKYPRLLPHRYKKVGLFIALAGVVYIILLLILKAAINFDIAGNAEFHLNLAAILMLVGLGIRSVSKEKEEDELVMQIRLRSLSGSFIGGAGFALVAAIYAITGNSEALDWSVQAFMVMELWMYQLLFWQTKKSFFKENS